MVNSFGARCRFRAQAKVRIIFSFRFVPLVMTDEVNTRCDGVTVCVCVRVMCVRIDAEKFSG